MAAEAVEPNQPQPAQVAGSQPPAPAATMVAMAAAAVAALYFEREVFIPLALAILLSFALAPIVTRLRRLRLGRVASVLLVVTLALALVSGFAWLLANQAMSLAQDLPKYEYNIRQKIRFLNPGAAGGGALEQTADMLRRMGREIEDTQATGGTGGQAKTSTGGGPPKPVQPLPVEVHTPAETPFQAIGEVLNLVAAPVASIGIMVLFVIFVLLQREDLRDRFIRLFGSRDVHRTTEAITDAGSRIGRYLLMQLAINTIFGTLFGAALWLVGVPNAPLWGLIGVVLRFVPYIGAPLAMLFPLALSLAADAGWTMPLLVVALFVAIEGTCAYVLEPLLYGHSTGLSPAALIISAAFWTVLWGPVGLLLSTPLTACLVVIGRHVPQLTFLEVIFGNERPLSPAMRFYQRLLADDPREAEEGAEQHRDEHGLEAAFDAVVLPALGLVEADRQRGAIGRDRLREIAEDVREIVEDVAGDSAPPRDRPAAALCLGARGGLDEAGAMLLASLLRERGYDAAVAGVATGGFVEAGAIPREGVALACVSRVSGAGLAQARRAVRQLRARLEAGTPILVCLWNADPETSEAEALAESLGVERVATALDEALAAAATFLGPAPAPEADARRPAAKPARTRGTPGPAAVPATG